VTQIKSHFPFSPINNFHSHFPLSFFTSWTCRDRISQSLDRPIRKALAAAIKQTSNQSIHQASKQASKQFCSEKYFTTRLRTTGCLQFRDWKYVSRALLPHHHLLHVQFFWWLIFLHAHYLWINNIHAQEFAFYCVFLSSFVGCFSCGVLIACWVTWSRGFFFFFLGCFVDCRKLVHEYCGRWSSC